MPFPRWIARVNLHVTNRLLGPLARRLPGMGVVIHIGRKTHRQYITPDDHSSYLRRRLAVGPQRGRRGRLRTRNPESRAAIIRSTAVSRRTSRAHARTCASCIRNPTGVQDLLCPMLTSALRSGCLSTSSVTGATQDSSPGVSSTAFRAQSPDLRSASLMEVDFAVRCPLVRRSRLISGFCPSTRTFAPRFLQTSFADE
jgi:hypothetical protein